MKILVGYDGSNASQKALNLAKQHAAIWQGRIEVIRQLPATPLFPMTRLRKPKSS